MEDYRQQLEVLEDLESVLGWEVKHGDRDNGKDTTRDDVDEMVEQVAQDWPSVYYRERLLQWLQAGTPDLDDTTGADWVNNTRELVSEANARTVVGSVHDMLGAILYAQASDYLASVIGKADTVAEAYTAVLLEAVEHRTRLNTDYATRPPYEYTVWTMGNSKHTVTVTEHN